MRFQSSACPSIARSPQRRPRIWSAIIFDRFGAPIRQTFVGSKTPAVLQPSIFASCLLPTTCAFDPFQNSTNFAPPLHPPLQAINQRSTTRATASRFAWSVHIVTSIRPSPWRARLGCISASLHANTQCHQIPQACSSEPVVLKLAASSPLHSAENWGIRDRATPHEYATLSRPPACCSKCGANPINSQ